MCKKSIYKKSFLLFTIAGTLVFSHFRPTHADTPPSEMIMLRADKRGEEKIFDNVFVRSNYTTGVADDEAFIIIKNSTMRSDSALLSASTGGRIYAKKIVGKAGTRGLLVANGTIHVDDSIITVSEQHKSYGILFDHIISSNLKEGEKVINKATLTNTKLLVKDGIGIVGPYYSGAVAEVYLKDSELRADMLLKNKTETEGDKPGTITLTTDNSIIEGRVKAFPQNTAVFTLNNNSKWYLKISKFEVDVGKEHELYYANKLSNINQKALSIVSVLNLNDSSIAFNAPHTLVKGQYQTLYVGRAADVSEPQQNRRSNVGAVYNATGDAKIYFNTEWSDGAVKEQQKTDRLLVYGDVTGTTTIHFNSLSKNKTSESEISVPDNSIPSNTRGLSLVQVYGKADENSFRLSNNYITMGRLPYKYTLNAYGPTSSHDKANGEQSFLGENKNFWDFRLQSATLDSDAKIRALVPQVASYLVMPNAVFSSELADVNNQNTLLDNMRTAAVGVKESKKKGIFLSTYGNKSKLFSSRSPLQYGYGADVHYAALQAGIMLKSLEDKDMITSFGLLGTYGKLAFTPKDIDGADKSTLDKWSLAAYGSLHHNNGVYVNVLFSYGILRGNITTALIGNTAELHNTDIMNASSTVGQKLATGVEGLVFEPQAQLVYQHLTLGTLSDVDGFDVNMGSPHQWLVRIGGRLTQTTMPTEKGCAISFYGKLNVMKAFGNNRTIQIGDTFQLDSMGYLIEGGLGVNAHLSENIALHADVNYQHKLQKAGISGVSFSGGMQYRF
ncbi:outer membrane autotransporter barrel domain-containing protein [Bartonella sp. DB5-6]|uniref:autotransporter family protein n=1 Tax=Bartonella sp. DB5-6 TaxID=1094755 RepID=UPI00026E931C|nr:autotransporter outer membrane beta-barrel domain-containing protein [Bartonella sp. DB5-6]EJF76675.1 outer membrane autotransporter barrel domain-containing protein [Bartonella sp. DB5-6]